MTEVIFHTAVANPIAHITKLCIKALSQSQRLVIVTSDASKLQEISEYMWSCEPAAFVPHCFWNAPDTLRDRSHIFLSESPLHPDLPTQSLIHWGVEMPQGFASFEKCVEIIGIDPSSVSSGRLKWKTYQQMGYPLKHVALKSPG